MNMSEFLDKLLDKLSIQYKDVRGYREYHIAYYEIGFMSNECFVRKHVFWDKVDKPIDDVAKWGFTLCMGPSNMHQFSQIDGVWKFIYKDKTNYEY